MAASVSLERDGLHLDGQPFYLLSGCVHYFRWPQAEWRPLLEQARWAGLNTIDTVIPWNRHEPAPGVFDFAAEADLAAYLDLCHALGLKVIVRPGPYICAEWENGGLPAWLTATPDLALRTDDVRYLAAVECWFDTLMPILAPRQHTCGGPIILCQIENEHWASGVYAHDGHQRSLAAAAVARGITVPQYTCMGALSAVPELRNGWSGIAEKLVQTRAVWPDNPLLVSELWSGWFDSWGTSRQTRKSAAKLDLTLHQLTAVGCAGFSHWMWAGGTNFGFWGGRTVGGDTVHMTASYDYDAPVSEYGELRAKALVARRHHLFLGTLGPLLAPVLADALPGGLTVIAPAAVHGRSEAGAAPYRTLRAGPTAPAAWAGFQASFLQNPGLEGVTYQVFLAQPARHLSIEVEPASIRPIFANMPLGEFARLVCHSGRLLGFWQGAAADTLVVYGQPGELGSLELAFVEGESLQIEPPIPPTVTCTQSASSMTIRYWLSEQPTQLTMQARMNVSPSTDQPFRITTKATKRTKHTKEGKTRRDRRNRRGFRRSRNLFGGTNHNGDAYCLKLLLMTETQASLFEPGALEPDSAGLQPQVSVPPPTPSPRRELHLPLLRLAVAEVATNEGWQPLERPVAMEQLGNALGYGWYRAEFELAAPLTTQLAAPWLSDRATALLDGAEAGWLGVGPDGPRYTLPVNLDAGRHELRLLVDNLGRFNYGMKLGEAKGLLDTLYLDGEASDISAGWSALWQEVQFAGEAVALARPGNFRPDASDVHLSQFAFAGPSVWLLRLIEVQAGRRCIIHLSGDRNAGGLFVNGHAVERFSRHRSGGLIKAEISSLLRPGSNLLALNIQHYAGAPWRATMVSYDPARPLPARWSFRPGIHAAQLGATAQCAMAFYRATFARSQLEGQVSMLKLRLPGLHKGQIWLNGRNLARFWQIGPQEDYKLPVSWLAAQNELLIFAEAGSAAQVTLIYGS